MVKLPDSLNFQSERYKEEVVRVVKTPDCPPIPVRVVSMQLIQYQISIGRYQGLYPNLFSFKQEWSRLIHRCNSGLLTEPPK